jgi:hypothetical protein
MRRARMFLATLVFLGAIFFPALAQASVCRVADPTGTPLNVRTVPGGTKIVDTLQNGTPVTILDTKNKWAYIGLLPEKDEAARRWWPRCWKASRPLPPLRFHPVINRVRRKMIDYVSRAATTIWQVNWEWLSPTRLFPKDISSSPMTVVR